jgi:protein phosphatase-4 regulatory subunit 3
LALIIVEAEDLSEGKESGEGEGGFLKEELLLSTRVEKDDIYARQQGESID